MTVALTTDPKKKLLYILGFFLALFMIVEITGIRSQLSPEAVKSLFLENTLWGLLLFCLAYSLGNLLYVPGWIFLVGTVFALGIEWGGLASFIGAICSSIISFYLIRTLGGSPFRSLNSHWADKVFSHLDERPILSVTVLRLAFQTLPVLNYALALTDVRFRHYLVGTLLGLPLPVFLYCYFFDTIFRHLL